MASLIAADTGYVGSDGSGLYNGRDIYIGTTSYDLVGMIKFTSSINSVLGLSAISWSDIDFTAASLKVKSRDTVPTTNYTIGITLLNPGLDLSKGLISVEGIAWGGSGAEGSSGSFNLLPLFQKLSTDNLTSFTPNTASWWMFIHNKGGSGSTKRFERKANYNTTLTIEGKYASNIFVYKNSNFERVTPFIYKNSEWVECEPNYYTNSTWTKL